ASIRTTHDRFGAKPSSSLCNTTAKELQKMKRSVMSGVAFGLLGALMATGGAIAATTAGPSNGGGATNEQQPLQASSQAVIAPKKAAATPAPGSDRMFNPQ